MDDHEKKQFDALMALADFRLKRIFNRRDYEWKVTLGIWAIMAAGIGQITLWREPNPWLKVASLGVVVAVAYCHIRYWIFDHSKKSGTDWDLAFWFAEEAEAKLSIDEGRATDRIPKTLKERRGLIRDTSYGTPSKVQAWTTALLAFLLGLRIVL